jgi:hypothetical protein
MTLADGRKQFFFEKIAYYEIAAKFISKEKVV